MSYFEWRTPSKCPLTLAVRTSELHMALSSLETHHMVLVVEAVFSLVYKIFGGVLIGLNSLPLWIRWMKYISIFRYSLEVHIHSLF